MGWTSSYHWTKKSDVVNDLRRDIEKAGWKIIAEKSNTSGHWSVVQDNEGRKWIHLGLIKKHGKEFALKTLSEHMGPAEVNCPLNFLFIADKPAPSEKYAIDWRMKVIDYHAGLKANKERQKRELVIGQEIMLYGKLYTFQGYNSKGQALIKGENTIVYRLTKKQLGEWKEVLPLEKAMLE
jgi:hypothetical protein